ncbi:DNA topoisomerase IV subunit A [Desulfofustis glycolicus]|uniref:DNA topoisomerase IV subunit A n=1 Tax=Desulfofustis glycolicus DSM 9705 TaxID=1121409 RepID=A0A1M5U9C2_9BACT|nr:DNA topoisomerase IV subunit A [Desulfofustis glycolicus]SHH59584.1 DNA topoisomerase IV subunit A [Desulfofustis glycolicus DSM 9705]
MNRQIGKLHRLFDSNFLEYTSYVIKERAIPAIEDGLKPVQRRLLQTLFNIEDGRFHKVANVVGETMKLHPHGDASIFSALVNLANKGYLIDRQGNFGNIYTGDQASAARYIECRLSPLAKEVMFNKDLTEFVESYDGRMLEPVTLPAKIPLLLLQGADGIAVGMATRILPHNFQELLKAQIATLKNEGFELYPDFQQKGLIDVSDYSNGNGRVRCRARIVETNEKTITITEIPYGTTTTSLIESIEKAAKSGKIKILSISDYTAEDVEIEIKLPRGIYADDTIKALYAFSDCETSLNASLTLIKGDFPRVCTVEEVIAFNTEKLVGDLTRELEIELARLTEKLQTRLLEQIFIEERLYKQIEEKTSYEAVVATVKSSLEPFAGELLRPVSREDLEHLLEIRIKRISRHDIDRHAREIKEIKKSIKETENHLTDVVGYTISYLEKLFEKYGDAFPRQTEITRFSEVEARKVALSNLTVGYHRASGFFGHLIKPVDEQADCSFACSEYDRILMIFKNGVYKVIPVPDKLFIGEDLEYAAVLEGETIFNVIYREGSESQAYVKRFTTPKFILDKEYRLFPEHPRSRILLLTKGEGQHARVSFVPSRRAKSNVAEISFDDFLIKNPTAIGKRVSPRVVRRVVESTERTVIKEPHNLELPGITESTDTPSPEKEKKDTE